MLFCNKNERKQFAVRCYLVLNCFKIVRRRKEGYLWEEQLEINKISFVEVEAKSAKLLSRV